MGKTANWPKEPPALAIPSARLRFSGDGMATDDAHDDGEGRSRQAQPDQHTGRQIEGQRRSGLRHQDKSDDVQHGRPQHRAPGAMPVSQCAGKWRGQAPHQILQGDGKGEGFPAPAMIHRHRLQEQPGRMAHAHR
jgi:hypothetical protein